MGCIIILKIQKPKLIQFQSEIIKNTKSIFVIKYAMSLIVNVMYILVENIAIDLLK